MQIWLLDQFIGITNTGNKASPSVHCRRCLMPLLKTGNRVLTLLLVLPCSFTGWSAWSTSSTSPLSSYCSERYSGQLQPVTVTYSIHNILNVCLCVCVQVLRPGVLWFLRNLNDPDFNPVQEMIHLPIYRHLRRFILSVVSIFYTKPNFQLETFWPRENQFKSRSQTEFWAIWPKVLV